MAHPCLAFAIAALWLTGTVGTAAAQESGQTDRPNFIVILADDLGWRDAGFLGSDYYLTPRLDQLASEGIRFSDAYANAPNCAPSRASLLSGQYAPRHGIYTVAPSNRGDPTKRRLRVPETATALPLDTVTIAEALRDAGYATASIGKWHLGGHGHAPSDQGFDFSIAGNARGIAPSYFWPYEFTNQRGNRFRIQSLRADGKPGEYLTDRLTDEALRWLDTTRNAHPERPFFLYLSHYAVHTPIQAPPDDVARFAGRSPSGGHDDPRYAAMIDHLDQSVGRILDYLDAKALADDTVVVFFSDNGGAEKITSMAPLRGAKGMLYEGGVREPLVVRWPGRIEAGSTTSVPVIGSDLYPTLLELAGAAAPGSHPVDGTSLAPILHGTAGDAFAQRPLFWHFPAYLERGPRHGSGPSADAFRTTPAGAVRLGRYKLIEFFEDDRRELYDLEQDIGEEHDLAARMPELAASLQARLAGWRSTIGASVPREPNPAYAP